ncbi:MAG TPA: LD-carboxypeptidase [Casimicrobiaceae bacterium]|jgi:muramoyltetrapeptide carboxypeptidase|nr:LD-carboxypeptidase [Casimicrobiaceae bacterium]
MNFGFYAPAGFTTDIAAVDRAERRLRELGHGVVRDRTVDSRVQRFAAPDDERLAAIERMAADPAVDIACAVRGGYGWTRLLARIDYAAIARGGKRWLGHSDFTGFQLAALARAGMVTYGGPMAAYDFGAEHPSAFTFEQCFGVLGNASWQVEVRLDGPGPATHSGVLWGGNLALVAHLVGTPYLPDIAGGILVLEDVGEHPYRVERMLYQLVHAGILARQRAVLLGSFTEYELNANDAGYDLAAAVAHLRAIVTVPIYTGLPFGHVRDKLTLPIGGRCALTVGDGRATLGFSAYR